MGARLSCCIPMPVSKLSLPPCPESKQPESIREAAASQELLAAFVKDGFQLLELPAEEVPASVHEAICRSAAEKLEECELGNNIYPEILELEQVLSAPTLVNALEAILGPGFRLHRHRHMHVSKYQGDQDWHKDSYWGFRRMRSHRPRWAMAMYYPQDTVLEMGPTALLPGSQYLTVNHEKGPANRYQIGEDRLSFITTRHVQEQFELPSIFKDHKKTDLLNKQAAESLDVTLQQHFVTVKAGSIALIHYDLCHRGSRTQGTGTKTRFMFKFQFYRVNEPVPQSLPSISVAGSERLRVVHEEILRWLGSTLAEQPSIASADNLYELDQALQNESEAVRIEAAYGLGRAARDAASASDRQFGLASLAKALINQQEEVRRAAAFGLSVVGPDAAPTLLEVLHADLKSSKSPVAVTKYAIWALGEIGVVSSEIIDALSSVLSNKKRSSYWATLERATAASALGLTGQHAYACGDERAFSKVCRQLIETLSDRAEQCEYCDYDDKRFVREEATLSLLLSCAAAPQWAIKQKGILPLLKRLVNDPDNNEDRYVLGYAAEALLSLMQADCEEAREVLSSALSPRKKFKSCSGKSPTNPLTDSDLTRLVQRRICPRTSANSSY